MNIVGVTISHKINTDILLPSLVTSVTPSKLFSVGLILGFTINIHKVPRGTDYYSEYEYTWTNLLLQEAFWE